MRLFFGSWLNQAVGNQQGNEEKKWKTNLQGIFTTSSTIKQLIQQIIKQITVEIRITTKHGNLQTVNIKLKKI